MNTITTLLRSIKETQRADGAFIGVSLGTEIHTNTSIFATALIATLLPELTTAYPMAAEMCERAVSFLATQEQVDGLYSYFDRDTEMASYYPPDLDDTALATAARFLAAPQTFDGATLARLIHILTACEESPGGPYQTWYIDTTTDPAWHDIDPGVNANISFLLSLLSITLPNLQAFFDTAITTQTFPSRYYHSPLLILFFISRSYTGSNQSGAIALIDSFKDPDGCFGTDTLTAVAVCALHAFGADMTNYTPAITRLRQVDTIRYDPLYRERIEGSTTVWYANTCVSRVFIALALHRVASTTPPPAADPYQESVLTSCISAAGPFADTAKTYLTTLLSEPISKDVIALPRYLASLVDSPLDEATLRRLTVAHLFGWMGYKLLDSAIDGAPRDLAFAAYSIRTFTETYGSYHFFSEIMRTTEEAFAREERHVLQTENERYIIPSILPLDTPTYEKSMGHLLSLFAVLTESGYEATDPIYRHLTSFFAAFLHARQLSDDAHDYIEDLTRGHVTRVGARILRAWKRRYPDTSYSIPYDIDRLHQCFWENCFPSVTRDLMRSLRRARRALKSIPFDTSYFKALLTSLEGSYQKATAEYDRLNSFLRAY